ncbi:MAG: class I SAM-dependent methyltransferase [Rhodospirillales bacterium]
MTLTAAELAALARTTRAVYEKNAARFDAERPKGLHERVWIDRFTVLLPAAGAVLDLGCGTGDPIAVHLAACGFRVTGVDASAAMLALARARDPAGDWRQADMRELALPERFDGLLGWDSFFHLTPVEQRATLPKLAAHLKPAGLLLLTVGPRAGEVVGRVGDDPVYHSSLSPQEYEAILAGLGLEILHFVKEDPACDLHTILLARKAAS